jgi:hypothetical protein
MLTPILAVVAGLLAARLLVFLGKRCIQIFLLSVLLALVLAPTGAGAQTLDLTATHGRVYNIGTGAWTLASVPGVEMCVANFTVSGSWWFDLKQGGYFEQDWSLAWTPIEAKEDPKSWRDRFTVTLTGAVYIFRELGTDRIWMVETRYRIFGRN